MAVVESLARRTTNLSTEEIDEQRQENAAYEYLCHLEEARVWVRNYLEEDLPLLAEFEERLRNGVYLAKLGHQIAPHIVTLKRIYDSNQEIYNTVGLRYKHTDNINHWKMAMRAIGLPSFFVPNTIDVYEKKNMPKAIYCIHALSIFLSTYDKGVKIVDLLGKIDFSTDEINSVRQQFEKHGVHLPAFSKISSVLAREIPSGIDSFHTEIIAINIAIYKQNLEGLAMALKKLSAQFNVLDENIDIYQSALYEAKIKKSIATKHNLIKDNYVATLFDNFLTYEEISHCIASSNLNILIKTLKTAVCNNDLVMVENVLRNPSLEVPNIASDNIDSYSRYLKELFKEFDQTLPITDIQAVITEVNLKAKEEKIYRFVCKLDCALERDDCEESFRILKQNILSTDIKEFGKQFYHENLKSFKHSMCSERKLNISDIKIIVESSTIALSVNKAALEKDENLMNEALLHLQNKHPEINIQEEQNYLSSLNNYLSKKSQKYPFLTYEEIKKCIEEINEQVRSKKAHDLLIEKLNSEISEGCIDSLLKLMLLPDALLMCISSKHIVLYQTMLRSLKEKKGFLSHTDIQNEITLSNKLVYDAELQCFVIADINASIESCDNAKLIESLEPYIGKYTICLNCSHKYLKYLRRLKVEKTCFESTNEIANSSWVTYDIADTTMYFNLHSLELSWNMSGMNCLTSYVNENEIVGVISRVQNECNCKKYQHFEPLIISFQSHIRGCLVRKDVFLKIHHSPSKKYTSIHFNAALKLQSFFKMVLQRKKYLKLKSYELQRENAAKVIQKYWQYFKIKQNLKILTHNSNPPLSHIQKIIHLLEISNDDYSDEFKLHTLQSKVVQTIRYNQQLEKEVYDVDIKIGLLIRNRITLEELISHKHRVGKKKNGDKNQIEPDCLMQNNSQILFSRENNMLLESYENIFYLLQTEPIYLARLIVSLSASQATVFVESIIFSLYNYGSTPREEYLLLKLFSLALEEDIKHNVDKISDIVSGTQFVIKLIISYHRKGQRQHSLKELLLPSIKSVLNDTITMNSMDPVEIYKVWLNESEVNTGVKSELPYEVTASEALYHEVVNSRFDFILDNVLMHSLKFCDIVLNSKKYIPYGMLHAAKIIKLSLLKKFPSVSRDEVLKVVGNFLYYRYINPAISSPDIFNILELDNNEQLSINDRWKLSAISKFLQFAAMGQTYSVESEHLLCMNPYLKDCHEKFLLFFEEITEVKDLEEHFNIDLYSEALLVIPPSVFLTVQEIDDMHQLLLEKQSDLAPDPSDILHEFLEDLGSLSIKQIFTSNHEGVESIELCLNLKSKYPFQSEDETGIYKTYVETKFMVITLLQVCSNQNSLPELLSNKVTSEEELQYEFVCFGKQREAGGTRLWIKKLKNWKTLERFQLALQYNLNVLELAGYVSSKNDYQDVLNDVAKDIVNRWNYRICREEEMGKLTEIQKQLDMKTIYYCEKLDYYNKYIQTCLENFESGKKNISRFHKKQTPSNTVKNKKILKYSGSKLHAKGILIEIKDLHVSQFKNVHFEIKPTEDPGVFIVEAKFLGVALETVEIDIQELLGLQYQGVAVLTIFDCAKVNINLLLFLINKKIYKQNA